MKLFDYHVTFLACITGWITVDYYLNRPTVHSFIGFTIVFTVLVIAKVSLSHRKLVKTVNDIESALKRSSAIANCSNHEDIKRATILMDIYLKNIPWGKSMIDRYEDSLKCLKEVRAIIWPITTEEHPDKHIINQILSILPTAHYPRRWEG